jgi:hypothetical protein
VALEMRTSCGRCQQALVDEGAALEHLGQMESPTISALSNLFPAV